MEPQPTSRARFDASTSDAYEQKDLPQELVNVIIRRALLNSETWKRENRSRFLKAVHATSHACRFEAISLNLGSDRRLQLIGRRFVLACGDNLGSAAPLLEDLILNPNTTNHECCYVDLAVNMALALSRCINLVRLQFVPWIYDESTAEQTARAETLFAGAVHALPLMPCLEELCVGIPTSACADKLGRMLASGRVTKLRSIDIDRYEPGCDGRIVALMGHVAAAPRAIASLTKLNIDDTYMVPTAASFDAVAAALDAGKLPNIADVGFVGFSGTMRDQDMPAIRRALASLNRQEKFNILQRIRMPASSPETVADLMEMVAQELPRASSLFFEGVDDAAASRFANALTSNAPLASLVVYSEVMTNTGVEALAPLLGERAKTLEKLHVSTALVRDQDRLHHKHPGMGDAGARAIAPVLSRSLTSVKDLRLSHNAIGAAGAMDLANALGSLTALEFLDLSSNRIDDQGTKHLAKAASLLKKLLEINLQSNRIGDGGLKALATAIPTLTTLRRVALIHNPLGDDGLLALANALPRFGTSLQYLTLFPADRANPKVSLPVKTSVISRFHAQEIWCSVE